MQIVSIDEIPEAVDCPLDSPLTVYKLCRHIELICRQNSGLGLAATQLGVPLKIFVIKFSEQTYRYFINCQYISVGEEKIPTTMEGCLSLPNRFFELNYCRWQNVRVIGHELIVENHSPKFIEFNEVVSQDKSVVFQHEIDHQLGIDGLISNNKLARELSIQPIRKKKNGIDR